MVRKWTMGCKYAPHDEFQKHCQKQNEGEGRVAWENRGQKGAEKGHHRANKGYYGCANRCKYFEVKNNA